jgi:hypothetical protein
LFQDKAKFPASFAADVDAEKAAFWGDSQVPWDAVYVSQPSAVAVLIEQAARKVKAATA